MSEFNLSEFLNMGGYAVFVWSSFGLSFIVLLINMISPILRRKQLIVEIKSYNKRTKST